MTFSECHNFFDGRYDGMDYKEMYLKLFEATEKAINILSEAQRECEECYSEMLDGGDCTKNK